MPSLTALQTAKKILRSDLKKKLHSLAQDDKNIQTQMITKMLFNNEKFKTCSRVSVYLSRDIEVNTTGILEHIFNSGKECFVPRYDSEKPYMEMVKLHSMEDFLHLPVTKWNIKQPSMNEQREEALATGGLDLIIVPGIGFTKEGLRIGNGKGYYDVYLKLCNSSSRGKPHTIALAFKQQIVSSIPVDEHDMVIDEVLFPD